MRLALGFGILAAVALTGGCLNILEDPGVTLPTTGGASGAALSATGGTGSVNSLIDPSYCNGLLSGGVCNQMRLQAGASALVTSSEVCDIQVNTTPKSPGWVVVVNNCQVVPALPGNNPPVPDGGVVDGFYIDYNQSPAHVILTGTYCDSVAADGAAHLDVVACYSHG